MGGSEFDVTLTLRLGPDPDAARLARHSLDASAGSKLAPEELESVQLLLSELVTNSYRHAGLRSEDQIDVVVMIGPSRIRVEVSDSGHGFGRVSTPVAEDGGGWGLYLVNQISDASGIHEDHRTTVWFELERSKSGAKRSGPGAESELAVRDAHAPVHHHG